MTDLGGSQSALRQEGDDRGTAAGADRSGCRRAARRRQRGRCRHRLRAGAGRGRSDDVRHRGLRLVRHLHAGQEVPRLHRRPCAGAARRAARHVGQPDRERGARRLRLHPARPGERHRLQVDLRAGEPQNVLRGAQGARQPAVVAHRRARHRLGRERLDRAAARPLLVVGRRRLRPRAQSRAHPLHAGRPRALLPARRQPQARRRPRRQSRLRPDAARHRQGRRRRLLFRRDRAGRSPRT